MNKNPLLLKLGRALLFAFLGATAGGALATPTRGTQLDTYCATQPIQATAPQQSRPYRASGSSCLLCHTSANASRNNLNTLGSASLSCTGTTCPASVNSSCVAHAPSAASITAPPAGTSVAQGQSVTFTAGNATNPDNFPLTYSWLFSGGMPNAVGQSVAVPMTVAGTITSTLQVRNSVGMLASPAPTRAVTVTAAALPALTASPTSLAFTATAGGSAPAAQSVSVSSSGTQVSIAASAATTSGGNWLSVSPTSSTSPATLNISVNPAGLAAGTYSGTVTITGSASNSPRTVAVSFTVTATSLPALTASPTSLAFTAAAGGSAPASQSVSVSSSGTQVNIAVSAATTSGGNWLSVAPESGSSPATLNISVNPAGLAAGTYSGTVTITGAASNSPRTVAVSFTVTAVALPSLTASPTSLAFTAAAGGSAPASQSVSVSSSGTQVNIAASAATTSGGNWLSVTPASSTSPATLNISVNPAGLAAGTYSGTVTITGAASNSPRTVAISFTVMAAALPALTASPDSLEFTVAAGGTAPAAQTVSVSRSGNGAQVGITATAATSGGNWLTVLPSSSSTPSSLSISVNPAGLVAGTYSGTVTITGAASNSPRTVAVALTVTPAANQPLAAAIDTPAINVSVLPGGTVKFKGTASSTNLPLSFRWKFPGGTPSRSTLQNPGAVKFKSAGTYTVTLIVTDSKGIASAPVTRVITVAQPNQMPHVAADECLEISEHVDDTEQAETGHIDNNKHVESTEHVDSNKHNENNEHND